MTITLRRIVVISLVSAILPIVYFVGWVANIDGLRAWPSWLFYVWPSSIMFLPYGGTEPDAGAFIVLILSLAVNAVLWCTAGLFLLWAGATLRNGED